MGNCNQCNEKDARLESLRETITDLEAERDKLREMLAQFKFVDVEYFGSDYSTEVHIYHGPALLNSEEGGE